MTTIKANLCVRESKDYLNYHLSSFTVDTDVNFPHQIVGEVMNLSIKQRRSYSKILKSFIVTTISYLKSSSVSMANQLNTQSSQVTTSLPAELIEPIMELIKWAIGGSVLLTVLLLIAAGVMRQFRKKKEAIEWSTDILKGFLQIMIATPLVFIIYYIVTALLGNFSKFLNPF